MPLYLHVRTLSAVGLLAAGACALLGTSAAHASSSTVSMTVDASDTTIGVTGPGRDIPITLSANTNAATYAYSNVTVSIDTSGLAGVATATTTQSNCTTSGTTITCDLGTVTEKNVGLTMKLHVTGAAGATSGETGQLALRAWADGVAPASTSQPTTVTLADGPDLSFANNAYGRGAPDVNLTRGQTYTTPHYTFTNFGSQSAEGVTIMYTAPYEAPFTNLASNCQYAGDGEPTEAVCYFPNVIQPGESDVISTPQQATIRQDTIAGFREYVHVQSAPGYQSGSAIDSSLKWYSGTGPALAIQPTSGTQTTTATKVAQEDISGTDMSTSQTFYVTDGVPADLAAVGARVNASGGSNVTVTVGAHNNGPGTVDFGAAGISSENVFFTAPSGTTVTKAPSGCRPVTPGVEYQCAPDLGSLFITGTNRNYTFTLRISASGVHSDGTVSVVRGWDDGVTPSGPDVYDTDWSNDTARVVVNSGPSIAPVVALTPNKSAVWKWSGSGTTWTKIGGAASNVYAGAAGVFATSPGSGAVFQYNGSPNSWTRIGTAGAQFAVGGGRLYALTPNKSGVWEWSGTGTRWTQIGGAAAAIYAGDDGLFASGPNNGDVFEYSGTGTSWSLVSGPAASVAVAGNSAFGLFDHQSSVAQIGVIGSGPVGDAASSISAGGLGLFATSPSTGDVFECTGQTNLYGNDWIRIGGPGSAFSVGDSALYALNTSKNGVWKWSGSGSNWTRIGGPAAQIAAGD